MLPHVRETESPRSGLTCFGFIWVFRFRYSKLYLSKFIYEFENTVLCKSFEGSATNVFVLISSCKLTYHGLGLSKLEMLAQLDRNVLYPCCHFYNSFRYRFPVLSQETPKNTYVLVLYD